MALTKMKKIRLECDLRQWDVARRAGIAESYLSKIETGRVTPKPQVLARIAEVLGVNPESLVECRGRTGTGTQPPSNEPGGTHDHGE